MKVRLYEYYPDNGCYMIALEYEKHDNSINNFKESFLKRLGNIQGKSNASEKERQKIKPIVKSWYTLKGIEQKINTLDRWKIEIDN